MRLILAFSSLVLVAAQSNIVVQVGTTADSPGGVLQFIPSSITATNGAIITFKFTGAPGNHSVTQSTFAEPCNPVPGGFDSGNVFIPPTNVTETPEWNLTITDATKPIWFFCKQLQPNPHCTSGMVGAINAPSSGNTFESFRSNALLFSGPSGQGQGGLVGVGASASAAPGPITGGASLFTGGTLAVSTTGSGVSSSSPGIPIYTTPAGTSPAATPAATAAGTSTPPSSAPTGSGTGNGTDASPSGNQNSTGSIVSVNTFGAVLAAALGITFL